MWIYESETGKLSHDLTVLGNGYSGFGQGLDDPDYDGVKDIGPIPRGKYTIGTFFDDEGGKGPVVAHLVPEQENKMFGRAGFMIHGDNAYINHTASHGCIILDRVLREQIRDSGDTALEVI